MAKTTKPEIEVTPAAPYDPWKDMVRIKTPRDRNAKEDILVIVKGRRFAIQRGVEVEVPRPVYNVLEEKEMAEMERDAYIDRMELNVTDK